MAEIEITPKNQAKQKRKRMELWRRRVERSERKLSDAGGDVRSGTGLWKDLIDFHKGKQWGGHDLSPNQDAVTSNLVKSSADAMRPMLYFKNPKVSIEIKNPDLAKTDLYLTDPETNQPIPDPTTGEPILLFRQGDPLATVSGELVHAGEQTEMLEAIDDYYLDEMGVEAVAKRIINDAIVLPYGVAKLEYKLITRDEEERAYDEFVTLAPGSTERRTVFEGPVFRRIKPWMFLWDGDLDEFDLRQAHWVGEVKYLTKEEIDRDFYLSKSKLPSASHHASDLMSQDVEEQFPSAEKETDGDRWKVYEVHDLKDNRLLVWIEGAESFARDEPNPYEMVEGSVYTILGFDESIDSAFPVSLTASVKSKNIAYNKILSYMLRHIKRFNRKYRTQEGNVKEEEMEKFLAGPDGTNVTVKDMRGGPEPINDAPIPPDIYRMAGTIKQEVTEEIGVSAFRRAGREPGVETAYEASLIEGGSDVKIQDKRNTVRAFMRSVIRKLNQILKVYITEEQAVRIVGSKGTRWVNWKGEDIRGEFIEDVDIYSELPFNRIEDQRRMLELYSLFAQDPYVDPRVLRNKIAKAFDLGEDFLLSPQEMAAQQGQQGQTPAGPPQTLGETAEAAEQNRKAQATQIRPQPTFAERSEGALRENDIGASILGRALGGRS